MIRAYLVDDEEHALNLLEVLLLEIGGVEVVGRSGDPQEALVCIRTIKPDLVFLDIEMPGMYGIELAERIKSDLPDTSIVFVTAHNEHAIAAFEHDASDYLLKPPEEARLSKTVQRIRKSLQLQSALCLPIDLNHGCLYGYWVDSRCTTESWSRCAGTQPK